MSAWMDDDLAERRRRGLYRVRRRLQSPQGVHVRWQNRDYLNFSSNDYLGLAADARLAAAASRAARRYGCGAGASPLVSGYLPPLRGLERDLARWQGTNSALVFNSGFAANLAVVSTLAGSGDVIVSDEWNHASLIDGCRLSRAATHIYWHADQNHLADLLRNKRPRARRAVIVTDSVFSMDGDLAPLPELLELAERFDALLVVDEAHATGVIGEQARGVTDLLPASIPRDRLIKVGTLSKGLGSQGGFVLGSRTLIDYLVNFARPYVFSTALAVPSAAAARRAVRIVEQEPGRGRLVLQTACLLREGLRDLGYHVGVSQCQIVPVILGECAAALALSKKLEAAGLLVPAIRPPSVPEGTARLRISLTAGHTEEHVRRLLDVFRTAEVGTIANGKEVAPA
jgi:8-amino-7-oxononanoate synthase